MSLASRRGSCCILSKFYIKPQPDYRERYPHRVVSYRNSTSNHNSRPPIGAARNVVSYRNSTSNHNCGRSWWARLVVVSYRNSTSNHNLRALIDEPDTVVSYRNSTSNHNCNSNNVFFCLLYLIEILHQTTTASRINLSRNALYLIEILHQTTTVA